MRILLIRHGQTSSNVLRALDTAAPGADLTDLGQQQAASVATALAEAPISAIFASDRVRTQQTAAPLAAAHNLPVTVLAGLEEITAGDSEMHTDEVAVAEYIECAGAWARGHLEPRVPGGENGHEFIARFDSAVGRIAAAGHNTAVVVSHGAAIFAYCGWLLGLDEASLHGKHLHNTGAVWLELNPSGTPKARLHRWQSEPLTKV